MKYLAAYLLLQLGGTPIPSAEEIKEVLASVGIEADENRLEYLLKALEGKDIDEVIAEGTARLATGIGIGGGSGGNEIVKNGERKEGCDTAGNGDGYEDQDGDGDVDDEEDFGLGLFG
ncbi:hypothetical protein BJX70DRAFT_393538 [Aspergillus crustosus]